MSIKFYKYILGDIYPTKETKQSYKNSNTDFKLPNILTNINLHIFTSTPYVDSKFLR